MQTYFNRIMHTELEGMPFASQRELGQATEVV